MELVRCYCDANIDPNSGSQHLLTCKKWQKKSQLFKLAKSMVIEAEGPTLLRIECEALMMFEFPIIQSNPSIEFRNSKKKKTFEDTDKETLMLIEKIKREENPSDDGLTCVLCCTNKPDMSDMIFLNCGELLCKVHIFDEIVNSYASTGYIKCPKRCGYTLSREELLAVMPSETLDSLQQPDYQGESDGFLASCPCGLQLWLEPGSVDLTYKDDQGNLMSKQYAEHMAKYRLRCTCGKISCSKCHAEPYHIGKTCEEFKDFQNAKHCRYCGGAIKGSGITCNNIECKERYKLSCKKKLSCGHQCFGTCEESECMKCLDQECGTDGDDYCAICYTEGLSSAPSVQLDCGHILHYHCLSTSIAKRWVGPRITFKFAMCPSCSAWIKTPFNPDLTRKMEIVIQLYEQIKDKALKRLKFEGMEGEERLKNPKDHYYNNPEKYSLDRFSYYECFKCKQPYFGGKKDCEQNNDQAKYNAEELVCPSCAAIGMEGADCKSHGKDFIEFKCKFCCSVAAWFCWGNTHFCDSCHTRQNNGDYLSKKSKAELPVCLGKECPLKVVHPPNGEEFALGCTLCRNMVANSKNF